MQASLMFFARFALILQKNGEGSMTDRKKVFRFKQFTVVNDQAAMRVGTDGVLLGAWCNVDGAAHVLDVGTGTGVIALMVAQRNDAALIDAIDLDATAAEVCRINFAASPWAERLTAIHSDVNGYNPGHGYDLIVCNPPFFGNGVLPQDSARSIARHNQTLTIEQLISNAARLLTATGRLAMVTSADACALVRRCVVQAGLQIQRTTQVCPVEGRPPKRVLWEIGANVTAGEAVADTLCIENNNPRQYSARYLALCREFYLNM